MGQNSITLFTNDSGAAGGPVAFIQDAFPDVSDTPSNNTGFSTTISKNPMSNLYGNDDFPRFGPKTLWIKDIQLEPDRSKWVNGEQTYRIIWSEPFPSAQGYVFGNVQLVRQVDQTFIRAKTPGDGFGLGGVFRRVAFIMTPSTAAAGSATGTCKVDGSSNATTFDWSNAPSANPQSTNNYDVILHSSASETYDIHDYQLVANQGGGSFQLAGVIVYSEHPALNIDQFPGTTYNNKTRSTTTVGVTTALPSFGASTGGKSVIYKNQSSSYNMSSLGVSTVSTVASGSTGTNLLSLAAGTGASFQAGYGVIGLWGSATGASQYVGVIQSMSTDTATCYPTLTLGVSGPLYRHFIAGQSLSINASFHQLAYTFGSTEMVRSGFGSTSPYLDPTQNFAVWGQNISVTLIDNLYLSSGWSGTNSFLQVEGYFSAAEVEWVGMSAASLHGTMCVNGLPVYSHSNIGFTGVLKKSVFSDAGPGWNQFTFYPGASLQNSAISRINMYQRRWDQSASYGLLAAFDTLQAYVTTADNATMIPPGMYKRTFADQLPFKGGWTRLIGSTWPGGIAYGGSGLATSLTFQYYGQNFAVLGLAAGFSMTMSLDGVSIATQINTVVTSATFGFHTVGMSWFPSGGGTAIIAAIDFSRQVGEMKNLQTFAQPSITNPLPVKINRAPTFQEFKTPGVTMTYIAPYGLSYLRLKMCGPGGGGSGSGTTQNAGFDGTPAFFGPHIANPGLGAVSGSVPGIGGTAIIGAGGFGLALVGGNGSGGMENVTVNSCTLAGGSGGANALGGAGGGGVGGAAGGNGTPNTGAGGGGAGCGVNATAFAGSGGGAGAYMDIIIPNPASSYILFLGNGGAGGGAGTNGATGGIGGGGRVFVEEWYG